MAGAVDFFVSYTSPDRPWAEWIAWELEHAGHSVIVQAWDMLPGSNFVLQMDNAARAAERGSRCCRRGSGSRRSFYERAATQTVSRYTEDAEKVRRLRVGDVATSRFSATRGIEHVAVAARGASSKR